MARTGVVRASPEQPPPDSEPHRKAKETSVCERSLLAQLSSSGVGALRRSAQQLSPQQVEAAGRAADASNIAQPAGNEQGKGLPKESAKHQTARGSQAALAVPLSVPGEVSAVTSVPSSVGFGLAVRPSLSSSSRPSAVANRPIGPS